MCASLCSVRIFVSLFFSVGEEASVSSKTQNSVFAPFCHDVSLLLNNHLFVCFLQATRYTTRQSGLIRSKPSVPRLPDIRRWQMAVLAAWNSAYHRPHSSTLSQPTTLSPPCPLTYVPHRAKPHPPRVVFSHPYRGERGRWQLSVIHQKTKAPSSLITRRQTRSWRKEEEKRRVGKILSIIVSNNQETRQTGGKEIEGAHTAKSRVLSCFGRHPPSLPRIGRQTSVVSSQVYRCL